MAGRLMEVLLRVDDVKRSAEFYRGTLGMSIKPGDQAESHFEVFWGGWTAASEVTDLQATRTRIAPVLESQGYDYFWRATHGDDGPPF